MRRYYLLVIALVLIIIIAACTQAAPTPTPQPQPTEPPVPTTEPLPTPLPGPAALTAGELRVHGRRVYARSCAQCHEDPWAGRLGKAVDRFPDASAMLGYMRDTMPQDRPGSLEFDDYFAVLAMVLVDESVVSEDTVIDPNALEDIKF